MTNTETNAKDQLDAYLADAPISGLTERTAKELDLLYSEILGARLLAEMGIV